MTYNWGSTAHRAPSWPCPAYSFPGPTAQNMKAFAAFAACAAVVALVLVILPGGEASPRCWRWRQQYDAGRWLLEARVLNVVAPCRSRRPDLRVGYAGLQCHHSQMRVRARVHGGCLRQGEASSRRLASACRYPLLVAICIVGEPHHVCCSWGRLRGCSWGRLGGSMPAGGSGELKRLPRCLSAWQLTPADGCWHGAAILGVVLDDCLDDSPPAPCAVPPQPRSRPLLWERLLNNRHPEELHVLHCDVHWCGLPGMCRLRLQGPGQPVPFRLQGGPVHRIMRVVRVVKARQSSGKLLHAAPTTTRLVDAVGCRGMQIEHPHHLQLKALSSRNIATRMSLSDLPAQMEGLRPLPYVWRCRRGLHLSPGPGK